MLFEVKVTEIELANKLIDAFVISDNMVYFEIEQVAEIVNTSVERLQDCLKLMPKALQGKGLVQTLYAVEIDNKGAEYKDSITLLAVELALTYWMSELTVHNISAMDFLVSLMRDSVMQNINK